MLSLDNAVVYDIETFPNVFTVNVQPLFGEGAMVFEISPWRDDRRALFAWFAHWQRTQTPMVGYNNLSFDYPVLHFLYDNPQVYPEDIYDFAMSIINSFNDRFSHMIWQDDRFAPQIDTFRIMHFDNRAKSTSLKALQVNMRAENVMEMPLPFGIELTQEQINGVLHPYNHHDTGETKRFAHIILDAIKFRIGLTATLPGDVLNFNDGKIGRAIFQQRLGDDVCFTREAGYRQPRQTPRTSIALNDIIFPYIKFQNTEFNRVLSWMRTQTLTSDEFSESDAIRTKGVFSGVCAHVGGLDFHFGTGGIHGSVMAQRFQAGDGWVIRDIDAAALYPSIAIQNRLYPEHLGEKFVAVYASIPEERAKYKKGTKENSTLKLASNVPYGDSNSVYSFLYDPRFTMTITINGQLMLCMLAEWLLTVPTLQIIQINTDGVTYRVHKAQVPLCVEVQKAWECYTCLTLEEAHYSRMWIRDVNNYVAEDLTGKLKKKGAYWFADKFPDDISNSSPPAWHKDFSAVVCTKAAVAHMVNGTDIARFVHGHGEPFDFMCRAKVDRSSHLYIGETEVQRITRYYVANSGGEFRKVSPPAKGARVGDWKRRNNISDNEYFSVLESLPPGTWDSRIHTKNQSKYIIRESSIEAGYKVADCNIASRFDFENVNYDWYISGAQKLVVA